MKPIAIKNIGIDEENGLEQQIVVNQFTVDTEAEKIIIVYKIQLLSPKGIVIKESDPMTYVRYNESDIVYMPGDVITLAVLNMKGGEIKAAVIAKGGELKKSGNMKFDELRNMDIGQQISKMIQSDIDNYPNLEQN